MDVKNIFYEINFLIKGNNMKKIICDSCGTDKRIDFHTVNIPCHICDSRNASDKYTDNYGNQVSGRMVGFDLCQKCYNDFYLAAAKAINKNN